MQNHNRYILVAALLVLFSPVTGAAPSAAPSAEPPDAKIFFRREDVSLAELSPTGDHIAMAVRSANGRYQLLIASTTPGATEKYVTGYDTADVVNIFWVSKDRLVAVTDDLSGAEARIGFHRAVFAINSDGSDAVPLINRDPRFQPGSLGATIRSRELPGKYEIIHTTQDGSGDVIVGEFRYNRETREMEHITPYRLNTSSRLLTPLIDTPMPERANGWFFDANGSPRAYTALNYGRRRIYYRDATSWDWRKIGDFDAVNGEGFYPRFFGVDGNLYVSQGDNGEPSALYRYDVQNMRVAPAPVLQLAGFDYDATVEMDLPSHKILGFHFLTDARGSAWLDPRYKAIQEKVDKALASTSNVVRCARFNCSGSKYLLVEAASDREPTQYLLYDPSADKLIPLAASRPDVEPRAWASAISIATPPGTDCRFRSMSPCRRASARARCRPWCWCTADPGRAAQAGSGCRSRISCHARLRRGRAGISRQFRVRIQPVPRGLAPARSCHAG